MSFHKYFRLNNLSSDGFNHIFSSFFKLYTACLFICVNFETDIRIFEIILGINSNSKSYLLNHSHVDKSFIQKINLPIDYSFADFNNTS